MNKASSILLSGIVIIAVGVAIYFALHRAPEQPQVTQTPTQTVVGDPKGTNITMSTGPKVDTAILLLTKPGAEQIIKALQRAYPTQQTMPPTTTLQQLNEAQQAFQYIANGIFKKYPDLIPKAPVDTTKKK